MPTPVFRPVRHNSLRGNMPKWTRRGILKAGLTAGAASSAAAFPWAVESSQEAQTPAAIPYEDQLHLANRKNLSVRERISLDFGWRFHFGHATDPAKDFGYGAAAREMTFAKCGDFPDACQLEFDDRNWRSVDIPHDWAVELPFKNAPDLPDHGGKPLGRDYPETSIGWYRRVFDLDTGDASKRISVEFEGVFRDAIVTFNGFYVGRNFSGYAPFRFDLTDLANFGGKNVLTVRVDATLGEGWYYEGAGIYRHVWLTKTAPVHVPQWGTFVRSDLQDGRALLTINTEVQNESGEEQLCRVTSRILRIEGQSVASVESRAQKIAPGETFVFESQPVIANPGLWSVEEPNLYRLITTVNAGGVIVDQTETSFGIRSIRFDASDGFFLNGQPLKIKGTCNHQDHAGVGAALPDRLQWDRLSLLKDMGSNAVRTSHNMPTPEWVAACERMGMMMMCETRLMSSSDAGLAQLETMIKRYRNSPAIILWSMGNEEWQLQPLTEGEHIAASMIRRANQL